MSETTKVLLVGESWMSSAIHYKGFDRFGSVTFHLGAEPLVACLKGSAFELTHMPSHEAVNALPSTLGGLQAYDAILLSDIGANSLLPHPDIWLHGKTFPNRLKLLRDDTAAGGGLVIIDGYFGFQGIDGKARWGRTAVEQALPVTCFPSDDRLEIPEGFKAEVIGNATQSILARLGTDWPVLLGANEVKLKPGSDVEVLASLPADQGGHPPLVTGRFGQGRTAVWTSDIGPHRLPQTFLDWPGYATPWKNLLGWVTAKP